jgi:hypothetical protein
MVALRADTEARCAGSASADTRNHLLLGIVILGNLAAVAACLLIENVLRPWQSPADMATPGWCLIAAQAELLGFTAALVLRNGWAGIAHGLMAATLMAYAYGLTGVWLVDERRPLQVTQVIFRALEFGMLSVAALMVGSTVRLLFCRRLAHEREHDPAARHFGLRDLMFLTVVFGIGLSMCNLFLDHFERDVQLFALGRAFVRSLPATLPWMWGAVQRQLTWKALVTIVAISLAVMVTKALVEGGQSGEMNPELWHHAGRRAAAYAFAGTMNGLLLRGLGFRWSEPTCRGHGVVAP